MNVIPGLNVLPEVGYGDKVYQLDSFSGKAVIPVIHCSGICRNLTDFQKLDVTWSRPHAALYKVKDKIKNEIFSLKTPIIPSDSPGGPAEKADKEKPSITYWDSYRKELQMLLSRLKGFPTTILREVSMLKTLQHENIISYYGVVAGKNLESNYILYSYCPIDLITLIDKQVEEIYETSVVKYIMKQLLNALVYIHESKIIHSDINPENIVFSEDGLVKITGFHSSRYMNSANMKVDVCQLDYAAPEIIFHLENYGTSADIWSSACILTLLLLKKPLFYGESDFQILKRMFHILGTPCKTWPKIKELLSKVDIAEDIMELVEKENYVSYLRNIFSDYPVSCQDLIRGMIIYYPSARITAKDCLESLYFTTVPTECSQEHMLSILESVFLSQPMQVDG